MNGLHWKTTLTLTYVIWIWGVRHVMYRVMVYCVNLEEENIKENQFLFAQGKYWCI